MVVMSTRTTSGPPSQRTIALTPTQVAELQHFVRAGTTENRTAVRARIVLLRAAEVPSICIAAQLGVDRHTVLLWCDRFIEEGIAGLHDRARSGRPRSLSLESTASR